MVQPLEPVSKAHRPTSVNWLRGSGRPVLIVALDQDLGKEDCVSSEGR
jgi:hypothetical protein